MSKVIEIEDSQFKSAVIEENQPVLAYFWAQWCGPCRLVSPSISWIAETYSDRLKVVKLEVDASPESVSQCKVEGVPALRLFKQGEVVKSHEGAIGKDKLKEFVEAVV
ncbi:thioredoxin family protein [Cyanobacterium aponinum AL20118]|uniref:Thioredoxin n=3 Tax=Cyanobacterium aponinum TaxID=379064 RepID=K9Z2D5_CYAAP|nr:MULTISPECIES: thioredoxin family protein [Cyanobacterium]RMD72448.1 MAG: thioredoxin [Cyanobacteria bacterium J149]AFZ52548.1 Thioredoxin domain-containing protein [Cyanobacterium aponinum PCC 10605]MBD2393181.1 thioredoxin [Cyanobacterium aponinum FACHB-4101]MTF37451.1 thiol reductase thioredoxin [Cyanobacterium aponinum 0216]PHV62338.1 thioredoxin [Cyanobacterium aponinum IPPAS B-1201]